MADSGVLFRSAFAQVPLTLPSHASLLTGTYPPTNGVRVNGAPLGKGVVTLAEIFRNRGYRTGAFVSAYVLDACYGLDRGFDVYDDDFGPHGAIERSADRVTGAALDWLERTPDDPFFLWVHYFDPHSPYVPPAPFCDQFDSPYAGEIAFVDSQIDRLVTWLDKRGQRQSVLIVIAGDHGEALGEHNESEHGLLIYDSTVHVPLILSFSGRLPAKSVIDTPVGLIDVFPTIVDLLAWKECTDLEGESLAPLCRAETNAHGPVYCESEYASLGFGWAPLHSITTDRWKYIDAPRSELFDRTWDKQEQSNVVEQNASVASDLRSQLQAKIETMEPRCRPTDTVNVQAIRKLRSLGYIAGAVAAPDIRLSDPRRDPKDMINIYEAHSQTTPALLAGRYPEVIETMERLVRESPESDEFYNTLGRAYFEMGRVADAQRAFELSLRRVPDHPIRRWRLGNAMLRQNKLADALVAFKASIAVAPKLAEAHCSLGDALARSGKPGQALRHFQAAVAASPDLALAHGRLGVAYAQQGRFQEALTHLRRYVDLEPSSPHALTNLANVLFQTRRLDEATELLKEAIRVDPSFVAAHKSLIQVLFLHGKMHEGVRALREARKAIPRSVELTRQLAWLLATCDDLRSPAEALDLARQVVDARAPTADDLATLAAASAAAGKFDSAIQDAKRALSLASARQDEMAWQRIQRHLQHYESSTPYREDALRSILVLVLEPTHDVMGSPDKDLSPSQVHTTPLHPSK